MARDQPQINIRISPALREELTAAAANSGRSLTAEVVARLEQSFRIDAQGLKIFNVAEDMRDQLSAVASELERLKLAHRATHSAIVETMATKNDTKKLRSRKR